MVPVRGGAEVTKTLGQVAFEAWGAVVWDGDAGEYDHVVAPGWEAAAEAVAKRLWTNERPIRNEERAAIEAARKASKTITLLRGYLLSDEESSAVEALINAIEALEEVER